MRHAAHRAGFAAITGRPNAGKSTLLNSLIGERLAITAHQPQTTRTSIRGVLTSPEVQMVFVDTPGIHESETLFSRRMMDAVRRALADCDVALYLADATKPVTPEDQQALGVLPRTTQVLLVPSKIDRLEDKRLLLPFIDRYLELFPFAAAVPVSARKGDGLNELKQVVGQYLPEGPALFPEEHFTDQPVRFLAAEIIRGSILQAARHEVPHATAVLIEDWQESRGLTRIAAAVHVERPGQKTILVGNKGQMLKKIGSEAREKLERLLGTKVFLSLFVKVKPHWREDPGFLDAIDWRSMLGSEER